MMCFFLSAEVSGADSFRHDISEISEISSWAEIMIYDLGPLNEP